MGRLLHFEFHKLLRQKSFYICLAVSVAMLLATTYTSVLISRGVAEPADIGIDGMDVMIGAVSGGMLSMVIGVFVPLFVCEDYASGTIRNIITRGYTRLGIFAAKLMAELERIAREFLAAHGFGELCLSLSERVGSVQMMEFDCVENGVRCMGDSVRISVAGDRGDIYAFDAVGHVKNHGSYHGQEAAVSESAARAALPDTLSVTGSQLCCAPGDDGSGVLCYGFDCLGSDGEELLVLVNAQTGLQFDILEAD